MTYFINWQYAIGKYSRTVIRLHEIKHPAMRDFAYCLLLIVY